MTSPKLPPVSREFARVARLLADQETDALADVRGDRFLFLTVTVASPLTVDWAGTAVVCKKVESAYPTPAVGHRVMCGLDDQGQLVVLGRVV